jgi:RNA polymerase sigma-70 factor (ECF subfamily)
VLDTSSTEVRPEPGEPGYRREAPTEEDERQVVSALRARDEAAFRFLIERHHTSMVRLAKAYVHDVSVAEEVVQEAWIAVLRGVDRFELRSSLKTWIFRLVVNTAIVRAKREQRSIAFSALWDPVLDPFEAAVDPERFRPTDAPEWPGHWKSPPASWDHVPEERLLSSEVREQIGVAIEALPNSQRAVVWLRDVNGCTAEEVSNLLQISEGNQRVLLHRGRSRVRRALEQYLGGA